MLGSKLTPDRRGCSLATPSSTMSRSSSTCKPPLLTSYSTIAPKVTGMILDLEEQDFNMTLSSFELFKTKVLEAASLLQRF